MMNLKDNRTEFKWVLCFLASFSLNSASSFALTNSQSFTYQGRFLNAAGTAPLADIIDITFSIYDPAAACLLYEESQTGVDLTATQGIFAVQVGTTFPSAKRTGNDPHLSMSTVFSNAGTITGGSGCSYTPVGGQNRRLRVTVTPHSSGVATVLNPDQAINSVPQAQTAETLQGLDPTGFVQVAAGVAGQGNVSLANLISLTGAGDASSLHHHDSLYVKQGGMSSTSLGSSAYTSGNFGIGISTPTTALDFGGNVSRTIQVDRNTVGTTGNTLNILAGGAKSGGADLAGGTLVLSGGIATGSAGSNILFNTSAGGASGTVDSNPTTKMVLTSTGKLGVGAPNPSSQLEVDSGSASTVGSLIKGFAAQVANLFEARDSVNTLLARIDPTGKIFGSGLDAGSAKITNVANPTSAQDAATKNYVDTQVSSVVSGVSSVNTRTGAITLLSSDVTGALTYTPLKNSSDVMTGTLGVGGAPGASTQFQSTATVATNIGTVVKGAASQSADLLQFQNSASGVLSKVDASGVLTLASNPTSALHAATKSYVDTAIAGTQPAGNYITALTSDVSASGAGSAVATVNSVGTSSAVNIHSAELAANAATSVNTNNTIVKRDNLGDFSAHTISGNGGQFAADVAIAGRVIAGSAGFMNSDKLQVAGNATIIGNIQGVYQISNNNYAPYSYINMPNDPYGFQFFTTNAAKNAGLQRFSIGAAKDIADVAFLNSNVGIGTPNPSDRLSIVAPNDIVSTGLSITKSGGATGASSTIRGIYVNQVSSNDTTVNEGINSTVSHNVGQASVAITGTSNNTVYASNGMGIGVIGTANQSDMNGPGVVAGIKGVANGVGAGGLGTTYAGYFNNTTAVAGHNYGVYVNTTATATYGIYQDGSAKNYFSGNVGIGTPSPSDRLSILAPNDVVSTGLSITKPFAYTGASSTIRGIYVNQTGANDTAVNEGINAFVTHPTGMSSVAITGTSNGNIYSNTGMGIGVIGTANQIDMAATAIVVGIKGVANGVGAGGGGSTYAGYFDNTTAVAGYNYGVYVNTTASGTYGIYQAGSAKNYFSGNVGIGTINPSYTLHVNGSVAGTSAYNNLSDRRLKTDMKPLESSLEKIDGLHGITFKWKDPKKMKDDREQIGFIAQDVEKIFPQAVTKQNDGFLSVAYSMLIPPTLEAVKELYAKVKTLFDRADQQERTIAELTAKNKVLEERLTRVEKALSAK